jgi:hypothetical protein
LIRLFLESMSNGSSLYILFFNFIKYILFANILSFSLLIMSFDAENF